MKSICRISGEEFEITAKDLDFYKKLNVPIPTLSPKERLRRRLTYRNFNSLYTRNCSASGKKIISMYDTDVPFPVYDTEFWWSDSWTAKTYARDYDFSRSFFDQYKELSDLVPRYPLMHVQSENCNYANMCIRSKNCYLVYGCVDNENCCNGHIVWRCESCFDSLYIYQSQWCSNCIDVVDSYDLHYSTECANCNESYFLHDCRSCSNCFACYNLRNKQYCFYNEQLSKEEYFKKIADIFPLSQEKIEHFQCYLDAEKKSKASYPPCFATHSEDFSGNHIYYSKGVYRSYDVKNSEDIAYSYTVLDSKNSCDLSFSGSPTNYCLESMTSSGDEIIFSHLVVNSANIAYSEFCYSSEHLFGCNGLRNASYCILNKQYSKEEYFRLKEKIVARMIVDNEWGEFFPSTDSPFAYNESIAQQYLFLTKEDVQQRQLQWKESIEMPLLYEPLKNQIPSEINLATETVLQQTFECELTGKPYKISKLEFDFYKKVNLPLPRISPQARHIKRMYQRGSRELWQRTCPSCEMHFEAAYDPEKVTNVYDEKCYLERLI